MFDQKIHGRIPTERWSEFQDRLTDLNESTFRFHGPKKLREFLLTNAKYAIRLANDYHKRNDGRFIKAVADAEKCLTLLHLMDERPEVFAQDTEEVEAA